MEMIYDLIPSNIADALGWTVLHSFWQALILAFGLVLLLLLMQKKPAYWRYWASITALLAQLMFSIGTFFWIYQPDKPGLSGISTAEGLISVSGQASISRIGMLKEYLVDYFGAHLPLIVSIWLVGMAFFALRLLGGLAYVRHLRSYRVSPLPKEWQRRASHLISSLKLNQSITIVQSAVVKVPMVIGFIKPVILLPIATINLLTPAQVEAIIAHELAHVSRKDYIINIVQSFIEVLFYFNPAVWWISAYIRAERENCCDDVAVALCDDALAYAKALVQLEEAYQSSPRMAMALARKGKGRLLFRIRRILNQPQTKKSPVMEKITAMALLLFAILALSFDSGAATEADSNLLECSLDPLSELILESRKAIGQQSKLDTLPKQDIHIRSKQDGKEMDAVIKNGEIQSLKIDGKEIPEDEMGKYEAEVEALIGNLPSAPPAPPAPPVPPAPPAPPSPRSAPAPPAPPAPGAEEQLSVFEWNDDSIKVIMIQVEESLQEEQVRLEKIEEEMLREQKDMDRKVRKEVKKQLRMAEKEIERAMREVEVEIEKMENGLNKLHLRYIDENGEEQILDWQGKGDLPEELRQKLKEKEIHFLDSNSVGEQKAH